MKQDKPVAHLPDEASLAGRASSLPSVPPSQAGIVRHGKKRPDVLFIAIDDMNDWTTLFDENNPIQTPNLKRLAARGAFFSKAYCAVPACNPSRTAILTGLSPVTSGVYSNGQSWKQLLPDVVTLPQYFGQHRFATKGGGKIFHHGGTGTDRVDNPSFEEFFKLRIHSGKPETNYNGYVRDERNIGGLASPGWDWGVHDVDKQTDEYTVEYVSKVMESESRDRPLFLAAGIFRPHLPFWAPPESFTRYSFDELKLPPRPENDLSDVPPLGVKMSRTESFIFDNAIKPPVDRPGSLRKMVQCYQAAADYADEMVGRLIDQLDKTGRANNTIIVLWSDHGYHLGDKNATVKFTLWDKANHVPFIVVAPGVTKPGTVIDRPVSLLDIYPTLVDLAGLPKKDGLDGVSLVPLLKNPKTEWNRPAVMTQGAGNHAVRSDRWRYIRYSDGTEELYDHENDPWEHTNLAADPNHASVIAQHRKWLPKGGIGFQPVNKPPTKKTTGKMPIPRNPTRVDVTAAEYKPADNDILIADFEGDDYGDWQVVGEDVAEFIGKQAVLKIVDKHSGGWGHTVVDHIFQSDRPMPVSIPALSSFAPRENALSRSERRHSTNSAGFIPSPKPGVALKDEWSTFPLYDAARYDQPMRPQFHFTSKSTKLNDVSVKEANAKLAELTPELIDLTLTFEPKGNLALNVRGLAIHYDAAKQEFQFTNKARVEGEKAGMLRLPKERQRPYRDNGLRTIPAPMVDAKVTVRALVDRASLELFVNNGQAAASFVVVPNAAKRRIAIEGNDELMINSLLVNELKSVWPPELVTRSVNFEVALSTLPVGESGWADELTFC
jgi:arylsulfatase A-like enzyme